MISVLEPRVLLSAVTVSSTADSTTADDDLTLREAIAIISDSDLADGVAGLGGRMLTSSESARVVSTFDSDDDTILFDSGVARKSIILNGTRLEIAGGHGSLTIDGGTGGVTIDGDSGAIINGGIKDSRIFLIFSGATVSLNALTLTKGHDNSGGAIYNGGALTITNCTLSNNSSSTNGGAILNSGALTLTNCTFGGNSAAGGGGAIESSGTLTVTNCTFSDNSAHYGGTVSNFFNPATLTNTIIANSGGGDLFSFSGGTFNGTNNLIGGHPGLAPLGNYGGPTPTMALLPGSPAIGTGVAVNGVTTDQRGFALPAAPDIGAFQSTGLVVTTTADESTAGELSLRDAIHLANSFGAAGSPGTVTFAPTVQGQTILLNGTRLELTPVFFSASPITIDGGANGVTIDGNNASTIFQVVSSSRVALNNLTIQNGNGLTGGAIANQGLLWIANCTITENVALNGGGIFNVGILAVTNSTFSANGAANKGGGIANGGTLTVTNSTFSGNAAGGGGGIANFSGTTTLVNSIVAHSTSGGDLEGTFTGSNDLIGDGSGTGLTSPLTGDPQFHPDGLKNNGGPTQTIALLVGSPAINAGNNGLALDANGNPLTADQRGLGPRASNGVVDLGAFESGAVAPEVGSLVVTTNVDTSNTFDFRTTLREAIAFAATLASPQTITFDSSVAGQIIALNGTQLKITGGHGALTIDGGGNGITVDGTNASRVFQVDSGATVALNALTITHGKVIDLEQGDVTVFARGGGIDNWGTLIVSNCTLSDNSSSSIAGGIYNQGTLTVSNSTLAGNSALLGGGILNQGTVTFINSTLANNAAGILGGGIFASLGAATLNNTIVANNSGGDLYADSNGSFNGSFNGTSNLIGDGSGIGLTNSLTGDPRFASTAPQDNGGPTRTLALAANSPAINAGDNSVVPAGVTTDQRGSGFARIRGGTVDLGAFEVAGDLPTVSSNRTFVTVTKGLAATNTGAYGDPQGRSTVNLRASRGTVTKNDSIGSWQWSYIPPDDLSTPVDIVITATDDTGMKTHTTFSVSVVNVAPGIQISGARSVAGGTTYTLNLGAVSAPGASTVSQYIVHWGDGTSDIYTSPGDKTHVYADGDALRFITVDLVDEDGSHTNTASVTVAASNYGVGQQPISLAKGDFDGDGRPDLVTADGQSNTVSVLLNNGAGGFAPAVPYSVGLAPTAVTVGDFNGDGRVDLAVAHYLSGNETYYSDSVSVLMNQGDGTFAAAVEFPAGYSAIAIAADDLNGDGRADLVTVNDALGDVTVLLSNSAGGFELPATYAVGAVPRSVTVGDFNQDGKADIAVANSGSGNMSILLNAGNGSFGAAVNIPVGVAPSQVAAGDFNGDANLDLVLSDGDSGNVWVMLGDGAENFSSPVSYATGGGSLSIGDFNNDGKPDLAVGDSAVSLLLNSGNGSFARISGLSTPNGAQSLAVADYDGDGLQDLAVVSHSADVVSILSGPGVKVTRFSPTGLSAATPTADMTPTISWAAVSTAVRYDLWLGNLVTNEVIRQTVTGTSWTPSTDLGIGRFRVWVRSVNASNVKSAWSPSVTFLINTPVTIPAPIEPQRTVRPVISWNPLRGAATYEIWVADTSRGISSLVRRPGLTAAAWTADTDLALGRYRIWVRGIDASGRAARWSTAVTLVVSAPPVADNPLFSTFSRSPVLSWTSASGTSTVDLMLVSHSTGERQTILGITGHSWSPATPLADGGWNWRVRATSVFGELTAWSEKSSVYVGGLTVNFDVVSGPPVTFQWMSVSGAASYQLWVNRVDIPQAVLRLEGLTSVSYPSAPLAAGVYRGWIRAVSTSGELGRWSRMVEFTVTDAERFPNAHVYDSALEEQWAGLNVVSGLRPVAADPSVSPAGSEAATAGTVPVHEERAVRNSCEGAQVAEPESTTPDGLRFAAEGATRARLLTLQSAPIESATVESAIVDDAFAESLTAILDHLNV